jgi:hypothetical protein
MHKSWVTFVHTVAPDICGLEFASYDSSGTWEFDEAPRVVDSFCIPGINRYVSRNHCNKEVGCKCCLELHILLFTDIKHYIRTVNYTLYTYYIIYRIVLCCVCCMIAFRLVQSN